MDCTDIVIGSARGNYSRIGDYYTRDRSTPVPDEQLGGHNSLTAALVWEEGPHTLMLFRRKLTSNDSADHSLEDEVTHVIWALGQEPDGAGRYNHWPPSALESGDVSIAQFYRRDELKYHGHRGQRGATSLNFYAVDDPQGSDSAGCLQGSCASSECGLDFSWTYSNLSDLITFNISSSSLVSPGRWMALGFSDDSRMANSDVIYGGIDHSGTPFIRDGWLYGYAQPRVDSRQDAVLVSAQHVNNATTLVFTRPRTTDDSDDLDLSVCRFVFFAADGGPVFPGNANTIGQHRSTPVVSSQRICFGFCQSEDDETTTVTTSSATAVQSISTTGSTLEADSTTLNNVTQTTGTTRSVRTTTRSEATTGVATTTVEDSLQSPADSEKQERFKTRASIRLALGDFRPELSDPNSVYFIRLANIVESNMNVLLLPSLGKRLLGVSVKGFRPGSIIVDVEIETVHGGMGVAVEEVRGEVEAAVLTSLANRTLAGFGDVQVLGVFPPSAVTGDDDTSKGDDSALTEVEIIVIAVASALVLVAIIIGVCKFVESRGTPQSRDKQVVSRGDSTSMSSGSGESSRKDTMSYSEFLALAPHIDQTSALSSFSAVDNPAYSSVGSKHVP
ncbi:uncharacterized protein LOC143294544 [Babylonia areolata]|uniref:uncharacterized protein LOC143294544 n=1 Tax=Babylonia areolata TaxID=304850 RepID=UPI003FD4E759